MKGYMGSVLIVDLTTGEMRDEKIPDEIYENLLSGLGVGAYMLYRHIPANADPLGPDNMLGFTSGVLTATPTFMTGRWMAMAKSPLTGGWGEANCGGTFSPEIKRCGYDGIFITGKSDRPVYLYVDHKGPQIREASHVWGKDATETEHILTEECKKKRTPRVALIGQAGEKLSLISGITNDYGRIAARSGLGAVMGSKMLKAVVLSGKKRVKCANPSRLKELSKEFGEKVTNANLPKIMNNWFLNFMNKLPAMGNPKKVGPHDDFGMLAGIYKKYGTCIGTSPLVIVGDAPVKNWGGSVVDYPAKKYKKMNADKIIKREEKKYHCYACAFGCGGICNIKDVNDGKFTHTHKPEYETLAVFGSMLLNDDQNSVLYINELLNRAGMDSISAGHCVAFAIECFENGLLSKADMDGLDLNWGNADAIIELVKKMIDRDGIGDLLADGTKAAAEKIGRGSEKYAVHAGGQEPGAHDPRFSPNLAIGYSCDPAPGRHTHMASHYENLFLWDFVSWAPKLKSHPKSEDFIPSQEGAMKAVATSCYKMLTDGAGACIMPVEHGAQHFNLFEMLDAATGWGKTPDDYMEIGKQVITLRQLFNIKHGINPIDFKIHDRLSSPQKAGFTKGRSIQTETMMKFFWNGIGWDRETGEPPADLLTRLNLDKQPELA